MDELEKIIQQAVDLKQVPDIVLMATNCDGSLEYTASFHHNANSRLSAHSTYWIASCTKLMTTIAALQCIERGLFSLDSSDDVKRLIPELTISKDLITGIDESDSPIIENATTDLTLRHLLTHTSGIGYDASGPLLQCWRQSRGEELQSFCGEVIIGYLTPFLFTPGSSWKYGAGLDWAGLMVERANRGKKLGQYMKENIWDPLNMTSTIFNLAENESVRERLVDMFTRLPEGGLSPVNGHLLADPAADDIGGAGVYSSPSDFIKILGSILRDDQMLLNSESVEQMFTPQLTPQQKRAFTQLAHTTPAMNNQLTSGVNPGTQVTWGLGGILMEEDLSDGRKKGSMYWSGMPNLHWWIDCATGVCGLYASQLIPPGDSLSLDLFRFFVTGITKQQESVCT